jgi:hypothetical protein
MPDDVWCDAARRRASSICCRPLPRHDRPFYTPDNSQTIERCDVRHNEDIVCYSSMLYESGVERERRRTNSQQTINNMLQLLLALTIVAVGINAQQCIDLLQNLDTLTVPNLLSGMVPLLCANPGNASSSAGVKFGAVQADVSVLAAVLLGGGQISINGTLHDAGSSNITANLACAASNAFGQALLASATMMEPVQASQVV